MDAVEFVKERQRMCKSYGEGCRGCPMDRKPCGGYRDVGAENLVRAVEAWSAAHPRKTRQDIFLEQWPNAKCVGNILTICPQVVDMKFSCSTYSNVDIGCPNCRRKFWMQEVE